MIRRFVLVLTLTLAAGSAQYLSADPRYSCYSVPAGDTVAQAAVRLTRDARNRHEAWFQILDPATARFVPKTQYARIEPGWQVCIAQEILGSSQSPLQQRAQKRPTIHWWWVPVLFTATVFTWMGAQEYAHRRRKTFLALERFGNTFVREFERSLIEQPSAAAPLRSRLRINPDRERLDILLAPNNGRRYPNLSDHRKNVEYDVERVVTVLDDKRFVCGPLGAQGPWVVIPCRLKVAPESRGDA